MHECRLRINRHQLQLSRPQQLPVRHLRRSASDPMLQDTEIYSFTGQDSEFKDVWSGVWRSLAPAGLQASEFMRHS